MEIRRTGERRTASSRRASTRRSRRATTRNRTAATRSTGRKVGTEHWLMTSVGCHEPAYPMSDIGLARGCAPSNPARTPGRRPRRLRRRRRCSRHRAARSAGWRAPGGARRPGTHGRPRPSSVDTLLRLRSGPADDSRGRPCGIAFVGPAERLAPLTTNSACATPLSRRTRPATAATNRPPARAEPPAVERRSGHSGRDPRRGTGSSITGRASRTETRPAAGRRSCGSRSRRRTAGV